MDRRVPLGGQLVDLVDQIFEPLEMLGTHLYPSDREKDTALKSVGLKRFADRLGFEVSAVQEKTQEQRETEMDLIEGDGDPADRWREIVEGRGRVGHGASIGRSLGARG